MLLRLVKKSRSAGYLVFILVTTGAWLNHLLTPFEFRFQEKEELFVLFGLINNLLADQPLLRTSIALFLLALNSLLLFRIYREYLFLNSWSLLPAIMFVVLTSGIPGFQTLHPVWFAIPFLSLSIDRLFVAFDERKPYENLFEAGFFLSLGSLFYLPLMILVPAFMIGGYFITRDARWREIVILLTGAIVPWIFTFAVYFLLDRSSVLSGTIMTLLTSPAEKAGKNIPLLVFAGVTGLLTLAGSYRILRQLDEKKVSFRKFYTFFFLLFVSTVLAFLFIPSVSGSMLIMTAVPVTFLLSNYFESTRFGYFGEILFLLIIGLVVYIQLF